MTGRDKIQSLSDYELATRLVWYQDSGLWGRTGWCGDFGIVCSSKEEAVQREVDWLRRNMPEK